MNFWFNGKLKLYKLEFRFVLLLLNCLIKKMSSITDMQISIRNMKKIKENAPKNAVKD